MLSTKSQIIVEFGKAGEMWDYEAVDKALAIQGETSERWHYIARFLISELAGSYVIAQTGYDAESDKWGGKIAYRYAITDYGRKLIKTMLKG